MQAIEHTVFERCRLRKSSRDIGPSREPMPMPLSLLISGPISSAKFRAMSAESFDKIYCAKAFQNSLEMVSILTILLPLKSCSTCKTAQVFVVEAQKA